MQTVVIFILILSLLVFVHELGHFIFAKRAGILVREFAIGFGPKVISKVKGETLYSIRILPLGGFVRMAGEDGEILEIKSGSLIYAFLNKDNKIDHLYFYKPKTMPYTAIVGRVKNSDIENQLFITIEDEEGTEKTYHLDPQASVHYNPKTQVQIAPTNRQFGSKTTGQKAMAIFAGPLFNVLLTIVLLVIYTAMVGIVDHVRVSSILPGMPAEEAGLKNGDIITEVADKKIQSTDKLRYVLIESKGEPVKLTVQRNNDVIPLQVVPKKEQDQYIIGVRLEDKIRDSTFLETIEAGFTKTYEYIVIILDGFGKLVTGQVSFKQLAGPVQMGEITGKAAELGITPLLKWTALLSLNLGIFNLLPIPALDGSRLVFIGIEAIRGRPISQNKEGMVHFVGFALLMMLMLVVTFNDIKKVFNF